MNNTTPKVIISLTSYPPRIKTVDQVIRSLLAQTVKPWKIVLWLAEEEFPECEKSLPSELVALTKDTNFEIDWCENIRSYKKLIPALRKYPDCNIVTVDDDVLYPNDMMSRLLAINGKNTRVVVAMRVRIVTAKGQTIMPYERWLSPSRSDMGGAVVPSYDNHQIGYGGVLYPPNCLDAAIFDMDTALKVCPNQDDIWFWAMSIKHGTKIVGVSCRNFTQPIVAGTQETALNKLNIVNGSGNDDAIIRLFAKFPEIKERLSLWYKPLPIPKRRFKGLLFSVQERTQRFIVKLSIPLFQMKYSDDYSQLTYSLLGIPIYKRSAPQSK